MPFFFFLVGSSRQPLARYPIFSPTVVVVVWFSSLAVAVGLVRSLNSVYAPMVWCSGSGSHGSSFVDGKS